MSFFIKKAKQTNKQKNINSVCLSRKDLFSDKVFQNKGPPDFAKNKNTSSLPPSNQPPQPSSSDSYTQCAPAVCCVDVIHTYTTWALILCSTPK